MRHRYLSATRTEKWHFDSRVWARTSVHFDSGSASTIIDRDAVRIVAASGEQLPIPEASDVRPLLEHVAAAAKRAAITVRSHRRRIEGDESVDDATFETISVVISEPRPLSFTLTPGIALEQHLELVRTETQQSAGTRAYPIIWRGGSGSILLHEAIGHPGEIAGDALRWPAWLQVTDEPHFAGLGLTIVDDIGSRTTTRILTRGEQPSALRRTDYRHTPLRRLTNVVVRHEDDPFDEPDERIEVFAIGRGHFDAASDSVELRIDVADLVTRDGRRRLSPFIFLERRSDIAMKLRGARGELVEYPGVICSREGQRLAVGSFAPDLLTDAFE